MTDAYSFQCPYCGEELTIAIDVSGGSQQSFIYDCEVCCRPIQIDLEIEQSDVTSFSAKTDVE